MGRPAAEIAKEEFAYPEEPLWLAAWVLGDVAERRPAKRQREPLRGMWINRQGKNLGIRQSDQTERNYIAAVSLLSGGLSMKQAISEIGIHLGKTSAKELDVLRTGIYRLRTRTKHLPARMWLGNFRSWSDWVVETSERNLEFVANQFRSHGRRRQAKQFLALAMKIRAKAASLGRHSIYRDATWYQRAERDYKDRASAAEDHLGTGPDQHIAGMAFLDLARLYQEQGRFDVAIPVYEKASSLWENARIVDELRQLMIGWIAGEIDGCRRGMPPGPIPVYSGTWLPEK